MKKKKRVKRKISFLKVTIVFLLTYLIISVVYNIITMPIKNIYISGNEFLKDQYIIRKANIEKYPPFFLTTSYGIEKELLKDNFINDVNVKKGFFYVKIEVDENYPLFYNSSNEKLVLKNGVEVDYSYNSAILLNYVPDTIYSTFINKLSNLPKDILYRISEIKYDPNDVDSERFLLTMNDNNYVYINIDTFDKLNNYLEFVKSFKNKKGILYLDSGDYFKVLE